MTQPVILDDPAAMRALDPRDMTGLLTAFPAQCREAVRIGSAFGLPAPGQRPIHQAVVGGLGGSAIGGDLLRCLMEADGEVPLVVNRGYTVPHFVGKETLFLAASYSGNTEETLAQYDQARHYRARIVCITSGGELAQRAEADRVPVCRIPGGQPPRSATGYLFFPALAILQKRGLLARSLDPDVTEAISLLDRVRATCGPEVPTAMNPAKQLAAELYGRVAVIYGSSPARGVVALRWKTQLNENAKQHAFAGAFPEIDHNEILAWTYARRQAARWSVVYLRDPDERLAAPRLARRVETTKKVIGRGVRNHEVRAEGGSPLARLLYLIYLGDLMSLYLAFLNGVDPTDIAGIDRLKADLARMK